MRKQRRLLIVLLAVVACAGIAVGVYQGTHRSGSVYSSVSNEDRYELTFDRLNTQLTHTYALSAGDSVQVAIDRKGGRLDVRIGQTGVSPIYTGNGADTGCFTVTVGETGDYVLSVQGRAAEGSVVFSILREADGTAV